MEHEFELADRTLAAIVQRMQDLPGEELFQYVDDDGETRRIESADVNAYLREISGEDFTSKDFRTWAGTVLAARALHGLAPSESQAEGRRNIAQAIESVARELGNTKAVCRKCYVHPAVLESYLAGSLAQFMRAGAEEKAVVALLKARLRRQAAGRPAQRRGRPQPCAGARPFARGRGTQIAARCAISLERSRAVKLRLFLAAILAASGVCLCPDANGLGHRLQHGGKRLDEHPRPAARAVHGNGRGRRRRHRARPRAPRSRSASAAPWSRRRPQRAATR